jgi:hypothetical protein
MRERMTSQARESADILAKIQALEQQISAAIGDAGITQEAEGIAKEEKGIVKESVPAADVKDYGDQNARANKNWPLTAQEKEMIASTLVKLAKALLNK